MSTLILAQTATEAAGNETFLMWGFILLGVAIFLLMLEFFVPSGGLLGILCGIAALCSIVAFFRYDTMWGIATTAAIVVLTPIVLVFGFKVWLSSPIARAMILGDSGGSDSQTAGDTSESMRRQRLAELQDLIGAAGVTETSLRPVGTVRIGDQRIDAMAESGVIPADTAVVVTDVYDNQIKVRTT